jgi:hypothetical protein
VAILNKDYNLEGSNALYSLPFVAYLQHSPNKNQYNFRNFQEKSAQLAYSIFKKIFILRSGNFLTVVDSFFAQPAVKNKINFYAAKVAACRN